jgi:glycine oxidase
VKRFDVIVIGAGVIGLSTAWRLRKAGLRVLLVERGEPGREASHAAAGMIAVCDPHNDPAMQPLAEMSAALYPEFVQELEDESGMKVDLRDAGVLTFLDPSSYSKLHPKSRSLDEPEIARLEPGVLSRKYAYFLPERWVDPRLLCAALLRAFRHRSGELASGSPVVAMHPSEPSGFTVETAQTSYHADVVVNCAGAWAGQVGPNGVPTRPVKGQMLSVVPVANPEPHAPVLHHVIRAPEIYLVPRSDGRIIIGSTLEEAGFDKTIDSKVIQQLHHAAAGILPAVKDMRIHEVWAGLRPGTPDGRPLIGAGHLRGYYVAAGHYRDGILLAPATAEVVTALIQGKAAAVDLVPFAPHRFQR